MSRAPLVGKGTKGSPPGTPPAYIALARRGSNRRPTYDYTVHQDNHTSPGPTRAVKHRKVCCLHATTATILVCVLTILIQVVPFMMIGGIFVTNGNHSGLQKPLTEDKRAATALMAVGIFLLLEAGGLLVTDVVLLLGVMMDRANRVVPYIVMQGITVVTGVVIAALAIVYRVKSVVEVMIYYGFAAIFNVFAIYTVVSCYLEMKEQERMYKYFAARMAELAVFSRRPPHSTGRFTSSPARLPSLTTATEPNRGQSVVELKGRSSKSSQEIIDAVGRSLPPSSRLHLAALGEEQPLYPDALANSLPRLSSKPNVEITSSPDSQWQEGSEPAASPSYWGPGSPSKETMKSTESSDKEDQSKQRRHKSKSKSSMFASAFSQTSDNSLVPTSKGYLKPSKRPSGGTWGINVIDIFRPQQSPTKLGRDLKSARDVPSLMEQWQAIQESLASQSDSGSHSLIMLPPNAPPGNKASYPGVNPSKIPPGNKASYSGSIANIPPGNRATSFIASTSSVTSGGTPSGSGHAVYSSGQLPLHPSSGHTMHEMPGSARIARPSSVGQAFGSSSRRSQVRENPRRVSQRERRFSANEATIVEETSSSPEPNKDKKGHGSKHKDAKSPKKK